MIPGETLKTTVVKSGTERQQGVAYLDDGVDDCRGRWTIHEPRNVTSALQTAAGDFR